MSRRKPTSSFQEAAMATATPPERPAASSMDVTRNSPFLPTRLETLLLAIYPATLLIGSLFSLLSSSTRGVPYSALTQSHPADVAPSYFAQKKNVFNVYFVKKGWAWTTLALLVFALTHPTLGPPLRPTATRRRLQAAARWAVATLAWGAVTQWFFGPALIDRGFRFTGGQCEILADEERRKAMSEGREVFTAAACRLAGGTWKGGHDISGHVFLLILGSALLWMEVLPIVLRARGLREGRVVQMEDGKVRRAGPGEEIAEGDGAQSETEEAVAGIGVKAVLGVAGLSWWMLLMTAAFFHTWFEKFTGLVVAFAGIWLIYFLPRGVPAMRAAIGMPGL